jgi:hypothetical protein
MWVILDYFYDPINPLLQLQSHESFTHGAFYFSRITAVIQKKPLLQLQSHESFTHGAFYFHSTHKASLGFLKIKIPMAFAIGIVSDVGHTGFEPVTSTLSR